MTRVENLEAPPQLGEQVTTALIDGTITFDQGLPARAERAITLPTPAGESPVFYLIRHQGVPFWYVQFHGVDPFSALDNVEVGFTRAWYVLHRLDVRDAISGAAVGAVQPDAKPGDLVIPDDFVDLSTHRPRSILTEIWERLPWTFVAFEPAMCPELRDLLRALAKEKHSGQVFGSGTYGQFEGHRFESPAEIRMARRMEADVVGHHQASEAIYARELGIHFAALSYVTNIAAGLADPGGQGALGWQGTASGFARSTEILLEAVVLAARRQVKCEICAAARNPPVWKRGSEVRLRPQFR